MHQLSLCTPGGVIPFEASIAADEVKTAMTAMATLFPAKQLLHILLPGVISVLKRRGYDTSSFPDDGCRLGAIGMLRVIQMAVKHHDPDASVRFDERLACSLPRQNRRAAFSVAFRLEPIAYSQIGRATPKGYPDRHRLFDYQTETLDNHPFCVFDVPWGAGTLAASKDLIELQRPVRESLSGSSLAQMAYGGRVNLYLDCEGDVEIVEAFRNRFTSLRQVLADGHQMDVPKAVLKTVDAPVINPAFRFGTPWYRVEDARDPQAILHVGNANRYSAPYQSMTRVFVRDKATASYLRLANADVEVSHLNLPRFTNLFAGQKAEKLAMRHGP